LVRTRSGSANGPVGDPSKHRQQGQSTVEFSIAAFLFFLLIASILDIGRAVWYLGTLEDATREAARYAIVHGSLSSSQVGPTDGNFSAGPPSTDSSITTVVDRYLNGFNHSSVAVGASWPDGDNVPGHRVTVTASMPFYPFTKFFNLVSLTLSASATNTIAH
jgi:Flp pilus assembly protein TadG